MFTSPLARSPHAHLWGLDPDIIYLNHGSYGACPLAVRRVQEEWRERAQRHPYEFYGFDRPRKLAEARVALAAFVNADPEELAFVPRAATGANAVLRSLRFAPGDELLTTDHAFHATRTALELVAAEAGATVVTATVPFPIRSPDEVTAAVVERLTPRTRLVVVDHVVSQTALVFPVAEIVRAAAERGIDVMIDGAHSTGQVPVDLGALGAAYFVGNTHKWLGSPPSAGFVHVRKDRLRAVVRGAQTSLAEAFSWLLPHDPTPFLCIPAALEHLGGVLPGGWPELMARNHAMVLVARDELCRALAVAPPCPPSMVGSMAVVPLPARREGPAWPDPLQRRLFEGHRITAPIMTGPRGSERLLRVCAQLYNTPEQYTRLAQALLAALSEEARA
jgi:isopenicillin-N epimerase